MKAELGSALLFASLASRLLMFDGRPNSQFVALRTSNGVPMLDAKALAMELAKRLGGDAYDCGGEKLDICKRHHDGRIGKVLFYNYQEDGSPVEHIEYRPEIDNELLWSALTDLYSACEMRVDALAVIRFQTKGFDSLSRDRLLFEDNDDDIWTRDDVLDQLAIRLARKWHYRDDATSYLTIRQWIAQFSTADLGKEAVDLLNHLARQGYVTENRMAAALRKEYEALQPAVSRPTIPVSVQPAGKSEQRIAYNLRPTIVLEPIADVLSNPGRTPATLVTFDDCIGSGQTAIEYLFEMDYSKKLGVLLSMSEVNLVVICYHGHPEGIDLVKSHALAHGNVTVKVVDPINETRRVFSGTSSIVTDDARRAKMKRFCEQVGTRLFPDDPLGWNDCQWCVAYDYSVPDLTLPVIFGSDGQWVALFPRDR